MRIAPVNDPDFRTQVDRLKDGVDGSLVATWLGLHVQGKRFFCPSCQPDGGKTADLAVSDRGFHCFKCGAKGDVIDLVRLAKGCDFREAVQWLARERGFPSWSRPQSSEGDGSGRRQKTQPRTSEAVRNELKAKVEAIERGRPTGEHSEALAAFLEGCRPVEGKALEFLTGRGIAAGVVERLGLRFCGREYIAVMNRLEDRFGKDALLEAGLLTRSRRKGKGSYPTFYPYFAQKIGFLVIPYRREGKPVYLKTRPPIDKAMAETKKVVRFLNTGGAVPCLYHVDALKTAGRVLICEGETDTMTALTHGYDAVGIPGWGHFKAEWVELFREKDVFLVLDADQAGGRGARDIGEKFARAGLPLPRQVVLPEGMDLNEFFRGGKMEG